MDTLAQLAIVCVIIHIIPVATRQEVVIYVYHSPEDFLGKCIGHAIVRILMPSEVPVGGKVSNEGLIRGRCKDRKHFDVRCSAWVAGRTYHKQSPSPLGLDLQSDESRCHN